MKSIKFNSIIKTFINWTASDKNIEPIKKLLIFNGYSLWWSSNLIKKDIYINNSWFTKLVKKLFGEEIQRSNQSKKKGVSYFIYLFLYDCIKFVLIKVFLKRMNIEPDNIFFYSLEINLKYNDDLIIDRNLGKLPIKSNEYRYKHTYIIHLKKDLSTLNPIRLYKRLKRYSSSKSSILVLDNYIKFTDIIRIHFGTLWLYIKFIFIKNKHSFRKLFIIDDIDCSEILIDELEQSFFGTFQNSLFSAYSYANWAKSNSTKLITVNTLETLSGMRAIYYFTRNYCSNCKFISIQHSEINSNKIDFINNRNEFTGVSKEKSYSPMPDHYYLHGEHAYSIVSKYMPSDRLHIIGCIKYDSFTELFANKEKISSQVENKFGISGAFVILIAPSIGVDFFNTMELVRKINFKKFRNKNIVFIISKHILYSKQELDDYMNRYNLDSKIIINDKFETSQMLLISDLLITGYSSMALESLIFNVPSIRISQKKALPLYDNEDDIFIANSVKELENTIEYCVDNSKNYSFSDTIKKYFFKIDGKSYTRFWNQINKL